MDRIDRTQRRRKVYEPMRRLRRTPALILGCALGIGGVLAPSFDVTPGFAQERVVRNDPAVPQYKPRKESTPRARIGGGPRGEGEASLIVALVPDHVGLTLKAQPSLCWYLAQETSRPMTFTLFDPRVVRPVLEIRLPSPASKGVHCLQLKDHGVSLEHGQQYRWAITIVLDPEQPSGDIISGGMIERIPFNEGCSLGLPCTRACAQETVYRYAEAGLWYDAMSCLHQLIEAAPDDPALRINRAALLKQIDLPEVAEHDLRQITKP